MQFGFIPDHYGDLGQILPLRWYSGDANPSCDPGLKRPEAELEGAGIIVHTYRCGSCGYLEFFAQ
jgi:hypothetical protein